MSGQGTAGHTARTAPTSTAPAGRAGIIFFDVDDTLATRAMGSYVTILLDAIEDVLAIRPAVTVAGADTFLDGQRVTGVTTGALSLHAATMLGMDADAAFTAAATIAERTASRYRDACTAGTITLGRQLPGAVHTVAALTGLGWTLGAATGRIAACGRMTLDHLGIGHHFAVDARSDLATDKAAALTAACHAQRATGRTIRPQDCAIVGDAEADMAAAAATGALGVGVTTGSRTADQLHAAGAGLVLADLAAPDTAHLISRALTAHQAGALLRDPHAA